MAKLLLTVKVMAVGAAVGAALAGMPIAALTDDTDDIAHLWRRRRCRQRRDARRAGAGQPGSQGQHSGLQQVWRFLSRSPASSRGSTSW